MKTGRCRYGEEKYLAKFRKRRVAVNDVPSAEDEISNSPVSLNGRLDGLVELCLRSTQVLETLEVRATLQACQVCLRA